jgi:putative acetyltransferase
MLVPEACVITIDAADCPERLGQIRELFREYAASLGQRLTMEELACELRELPGDYAPPRGCLLLARHDGQAAGCVALRMVDQGVAEIRRHYVRHPYRCKGLGRSLTEAVLERASRCGYRTVRLEALNWMSEALALYASLGFQAVDAEQHKAQPGTILLERYLAAGPVLSAQG